MDGDQALHDIARRYVWWQPAESTLGRGAHFLCHVMQMGTPEDVRAVRRILGDEALREALRSAPAGVLDARSWSYWHLVLFGRPAPPAPARALPP